jgi:hypothetical protein
MKHTPLDHPLNVLRLAPGQRLALLSILATRAPHETRDALARLLSIGLSAVQTDDAIALVGSCEVLLAELDALTDARTPEQKAAAEAAARRALGT